MTRYEFLLYIEILEARLITPAQKIECTIVHSNCLGGGVSGFWRLGSVMHAYHHFESLLSSADHWFDKKRSYPCVATPIIGLIFFEKRGEKRGESMSVQLYTHRGIGYYGPSDSILSIHYTLLSYE